jgi:hypothetical protein
MAKSKINDTWFKRFDTNNDLVSLWCQKTNSDCVHCRWCDTDIKVASKAFAAITQHSASKKHNSNRSSALQSVKLVSESSSSATLSSKSTLQPTIGLYLQDAAAITKEIIWIIHMTMKNCPDGDVDKDQIALKLIAPNDTKSMKIGRTKLAYVRKAIASWFWDLTHKDIGESFFTLMFDDTTNNLNKKELQIVVKYWSNNLKRLSFVHLKSAFMINGKAQPTVDVLMKTIREDKLNTIKLIQLGSDGPNVTKTVKNKMNAIMMEDRGFILLDIGSCHDHVLHNSLKEGCKEMKNVHVLCQQISEYFKSPAKWNDFSETFDVELKFVTFFSIRWTSLGPSTKRILLNWNNIYNFFSDVNKKPEKEKNLHEKNIIRLLELSNIHPEVAFVNQVAAIIEPVLLFLERTNQINFEADDVYFELLCKLTSFIAVPGSVAYQKIILNKKVDEDHEMTVTLSSNVSDLVQPASLESFKGDVGEFVKSIINYLNKKNFFLQFLFNAKHMALKYIFKEGSITKVMELSKSFSNNVLNEKELFDELTILVTTKNERDFADCKTIDSFFSAIFEWREVPNLKALFGMVSACSISNAEVERYFSRSGLVVTKRAANLEEESFNDRKRIISGMEFFDNNLNHLKINANLIAKVGQSHSVYKRRLEEEKQLATDTAEKKRSPVELEEHIQNVQLEKKIIKDIEQQVSETRMKLESEKEKSDKIWKTIEDRMNDASDINKTLEAFQTLNESLRISKLKVNELERQLSSVLEKHSKKQQKFIDLYH